MGRCGRRLWRTYGQTRRQPILNVGARLWIGCSPKITSWRDEGQCRAQDPVLGPVRMRLDGPILAIAARIFSSMGRPTVTGATTMIDKIRIARAADQRPHRPPAPEFGPPWGPNGAERRHTAQHRPAKTLS